MATQVAAMRQWCFAINRRPWNPCHFCHEAHSDMHGSQASPDAQRSTCSSSAPRHRVALPRACCAVASHAAAAAGAQGRAAEHPGAARRPAKGAGGVQADRGRLRQRARPGEVHQVRSAAAALGVRCAAQQLLPTVAMGTLSLSFLLVSGTWPREAHPGVLVMPGVVSNLQGARGL